MNKGFLLRQLTQTKRSIKSSSSINSLPVVEDKNLQTWIKKVSEELNESYNSYVRKQDLERTGLIAVDNAGQITIPKKEEENTSIVPQPVINLIAVGAYTSITLSWETQSSKYFGSNEVFRSETDNFSKAVKIGSSIGNIYTDYIGNNATAFYWVRTISKFGVVGELSTSVSASTSIDIEYLIQNLSGEISEGVLSQALKGKIDLIEINQQKIEQVKLDANRTKLETNHAINELISDIQNEHTERINQALLLQNGITQAQSSADNVSESLLNYKQATNNSLAILTQGVDVANQNSTVAVQKFDSLVGRVEGVEGSTATALNKANIAIDASNTTAQQLNSVEIQLGEKANSTFVNQIKATADTALENANISLSDISGLKTRLNDSEASITSINQTKADKAEIASIAQTSLQSIWQNDTKDRIDSIDIGGVNLLLNTEMPTLNKEVALNQYSKFNLIQNLTTDYSSSLGQKGFAETYYTIKENTHNLEKYIRCFIDNQETIQFMKNKTYTFSLGLRGATNDVKLRIIYKNTLGAWIDLAIKQCSIQNGTILRNFIVFTVPNDVLNLILSIQIYDVVSGLTCAVSQMQLQLGNKATQWSKSPLDLSNEVSEFKADIALTYATKSSLDSAIASSIQQYDASLFIGSRNYIRNTSDIRYGGGWVFQERFTAPIKGEFTFSFYVELLDSSALGGGVGFNYGNGGSPSYSYFWFPILGTGLHTYTGMVDSLDYTHFGIYSNNKIRVSQIKVEKGRKRTDWSPAPEDASNAIEANASVLNQTQVMVNNLNGQLDTIAIQTNTLTSTVNNLPLGGANLLKNSDFSTGDLTGWFHWTYNATYEVGVNKYAPTDFHIQAGESKTLVAHQINNYGSDNYIDFHQSVATVGGKFYQISAYTSVHRSSATIFAYFFDKDGTLISHTFGQQKNRSENKAETFNGKLLQDMKRIYQNFITPVNCAYIYFSIRLGSSTSDPYLFVTRAMLTEVYSLDAEPIAWSESSIGNTVTIKETAQVVNGLKALAGLQITNNGVISGVGIASEMINGQVRSEIGFMADRFFFESPVGKVYPMIIDGNRTIINNAIIKEGSIQNAHIGTLGADKITSGDIAADRMRANFLQAAYGQFQRLDAVAATIGFFRSSQNNQRVEISDRGLKLFNSNGIAIIEIVDE